MFLSIFISWVSNSMDWYIDYRWTGLMHLLSPPNISALINAIPVFLPIYVHSITKRGSFSHGPWPPTEQEYCGRTKGDTQSTMSQHFVSCPFQFKIVGHIDILVQFHLAMAMAPVHCRSEHGRDS